MLNPETVNVTATLKDKTFLVTGASGGLGEAIAHSLLSQGVRVILHGNTQSAAIQQLSETFGPSLAHAVPADLSVQGAGVQLWKTALAWAGQIDGMINNAGTMKIASVDSGYPVWSEAWQQTLQVNLVAAADLCYEAIRHFRSRQCEGILINIASRAAHRGDGPDYTHYAASKAGLIAMTKTIARAYAAEGIFAYTIAPGFIDNEKTARVMNERGRACVMQDIPMGSPVPPLEIANLVTFLASGAVKHATGSTFDINGASYVR